VFNYLYQEQPTLRDQVYVAFDLLACLPSDVSNLVGEQVIAGLILVMQKQKDIIRYPLNVTSNFRVPYVLPRSQTEWNLVLALIRSTMSHPEASRLSFELVAALTEDGPDNTVLPDNFSGLLTVLDDFASAASIVQEQQPRGRRVEPFSVAKYVASYIFPREIDLRSIVVHL